MAMKIAPTLARFRKGMPKVRHRYNMFAMHGLDPIAMAEEIDSLLAVVRAARPKKRRDNYKKPTVCVNCGQTYLLDDGKDPSPECHPCAQDVLADVRRVIARLDLISKRNAGGGQ